MNPLTIHLGTYALAGALGFGICYFSTLAGRVKMRRDFGARLMKLNENHTVAMVKVKTEAFQKGMQAAQNHFARMHDRAALCLSCMREIKDQDATAFRDLRQAINHS